MNAKKRIFKEKLDAVLIPGTTPKDEWSVLLQPICEYANSIMPSRLFRYRSCNEMQFDAFYNNRVYAVNAQLFNDPYDCLIRYDKAFLYDCLIKGASKENIKLLRDRLRAGEAFPKFLESLYGKERAEILKDIICNASDDDLDQQAHAFEVNRKDFFDNIDRILKQAEDFLRRNTFIACFSETVKSITMWSHYADSHKGFVLEYNLQALDRQCDTCERKNTCNDKVIHYLFPVIYDSKRYDGTFFVENYLGESFGLYTHISDVMFYTKAALHKSPQWQYEQEWRLFLSKSNSAGLSSLNIHARPIAIYYGCDISDINKKILSGMAKEKGLKEYQMYIDAQSERYTMKYRRM